MPSHGSFAVQTVEAAGAVKKLGTYWEHPLCELLVYETHCTQRSLQRGATKLVAIGCTPNVVPRTRLARRRREAHVRTVH